MLKKGLLLILIFGLCFCTACANEQEAPLYSEYTMREDGEPYSDWKQSTTGSAKYLDGDSVLVSIFVDTEESDWSVHDENLVRANTEIACDYLKEQGRLYGKDVNLIYDIDEHNDLEYRMPFNITNHNVGKDSYSDQLSMDVYDFIEKNIDTKVIMEKYQVNSIGYMVFVDDCSDKCLAYTFYETSNKKYYTDFCIIYLNWTDGEKVDASTYAHEILHLFGARDLYHTSDYVGIYKDFVLYAEKEYGNDIMLGSFADKALSRNIDVDITKLTAYFLGWREYITEIDTYPSIKSKYPASYCLTEHRKDDYEEFSLVERSKKYNVGLKILYGVIAIFGIYRVIIMIKQDVAYRKYQARQKNMATNNYYNNGMSLNDMNKIYMQDIPYDVIDKISDKK